MGRCSGWTRGVVDGVDGGGPVGVVMDRGVVDAPSGWCSGWPVV